LILIIDYGAGNLRSVQKALESCGADAALTNDPKDLTRADKVVFPGVGAFGNAAEAINRLGFAEAIKEFISSGRSFLGICLGMQMLFESSEENPGVEGLGVLKGIVKRFPHHLKVPHLGWNELLQVQESPLWRNIPAQSYFYFAHSYYIEPVDKTIITGETDYNGCVAVAVARNNLFGLQFHPEKSQKMGLQILKNFIEL
jgi:imidazole glycerol-phosphate synthase subunit HisH